MNMTITTKRYSADVTQLIENDVIVGFAIRSTNGGWCMTDANDKRMDKISYGSANEVAKCFTTVRSLLATASFTQQCVDRSYPTFRNPPGFG